MVVLVNCEAWDFGGIPFQDFRCRVGDANQIVVGAWLGGLTGGGNNGVGIYLGIKDAWVFG